jgi:hypothetical protein
MEEAIKAIVYYAPRDFSFQDVPDPQVGPEDERSDPGNTGGGRQDIQILGIFWFADW